MTVKASKAQLREIAQELIGPLLAEHKQGHYDVLVRAEMLVNQATDALKAERAMVGTWRQRIEDEAKNIHADVESFRKELQRLAGAESARDAAQASAMNRLDEKLAEVDKRMMGLLRERDAFSGMEQRVTLNVKEAQDGLSAAFAKAREGLQAEGKRQQDAIIDAGKHAQNLAAETRAECRRTEAAIKDLAKGVGDRVENTLNTYEQTKRLNKWMAMIDRMDLPPNG
jgi:hypothetical protein